MYVCVYACVCMYVCLYCKVWFHNTCINENAKKHPVRPRPRPSDEEMEPTRELWFCPSCRIDFTDIRDIKENSTKSCNSIISCYWYENYVNYEHPNKQ